MRLSRAVAACVIALPCLTVGAAGGQSAMVLPPHRFGIVGGLNSATVRGSDATNPTPGSKTGFVGGLMLVMPFQTNLAIQPELLFSMKGATYHDPNGDATLTINYVELPLLLRFDVPTTGLVKPFAFVGPAVAFRQACNVIVTGPFAMSGTCDDLVGATGTKFETVDYSAVFGGGLAFDVSGKRFTVGARFEPSLKRIQMATDIHHQVISVITTFEFPMKK